MILNDEQQAMLDGKYGEGAAYAMKIQVGIGECFDAPRMVPITRAHVALSNQAGDLWFAEKMLNAGAKCRIPPTVNPGFCIGHFTGSCAHPVSEEDAEHMRRTDAAYRGLGAVLSYNCTPYIASNVPNFGEICAFSESSATPYVNSVIGARTNREGSNSALCAAITGMVPHYGLLLDENRKAEILVDVQANIENDFDYQILGWCYPEKYKGLEIPVFRGIKKRPTPEGFMNFGAQLNTSGCVSMYHIEGITPEAPTLEAAVGNKKIKHTITITEKDLAETRERLCRGPKKIDFAMFGCPHITINQVATIAKVCDGRKFKVPVWLLVSSLTKELAVRMGYNAIIQRAGGHIVSDTCIDVPPCWQPYYHGVGVTDSPKCAYYNEIRDIEFIIRPIEEAVEAAIIGEVLK